MSIIAMSGGVGGAKLVSGLAQNLAGDELLVVANTADDFDHLGLRICPDLDSVMYALAGINDQQRGWGLADESWQAMRALQRLGGANWFQLGDQDLATHILRSDQLRNGVSLTAVTESLCSALGIACRLIPMTEDPVATVVDTEEGKLAFQEYFVKRQCEPAVKGFEFTGIELATANPEWLEAMRSGQAKALIICPSNPYVSVDPMLNLPGVRTAIAGLSCPVVAVSPIIAGAAIKGPAAKMMRELGCPNSALAVAEHYKGLVTDFVIDNADRKLVKDIEALGMRVHCCDSLMRNAEDRSRLAAEVLAMCETAVAA